jgi:hypothetical protein
MIFSSQCLEKRVYFLENTSLGDYGVKQIADALISNQHLQELHLGNHHTADMMDMK